jgi:post-segregation antitoxin (ccd killing protein)
MIISFVILPFMSTTERVTVTLAAELVEAIDRLERNRSRFIAEAVRRELERRRREALLRSIRTPHPESMEFADAGLADWAASLPEEEGLVDPAGGTSVRWLEGRGWVSDEPAQPDTAEPITRRSSGRTEARRR